MLDGVHDLLRPHPQVSDTDFGLRTHSATVAPGAHSFLRARHAELGGQSGWTQNHGIAGRQPVKVDSWPATHPAITPSDRTDCPTYRSRFWRRMRTSRRGRRRSWPTWSAPTRRRPADPRTADRAGMARPASHSPQIRAPWTGSPGSASAAG